MHRTNNICFHCHRVERHGHGGNCPECGKPMINVGYRWRVPKKEQKKAWKVLATRLADNPYFREKLTEAGVVVDAAQVATPRARKSTTRKHGWRGNSESRRPHPEPVQ